MKIFASMMGDKNNELKYERLADHLKSLVKGRFWDEPVPGKINRQTLFATLLYHKIIPSGEIDAAGDSLLNAIKAGPSGHFTTGIFGTKYILETLSEYHSPELVFGIVNSTRYPGWGYMIDRGATTIWETWKESDNTYSNCHPMFGSVSEWFYRWLGGIRPDPENPGFERFVIKPAVPEGLTYVNCSYESPYGQIVSNWKKENSRYRYEIKIPGGTTANVMLSLKDSQKIEIIKNDVVLKSKGIAGLDTGIFELNEGNYIITVNTSN
jgi:alpha-L-rhamnosidase